MVDTEVELRSTAFPADPAEDELVNPGVHGMALAYWVSEQLVEGGIAAVEPIPEDWGWVVGIDHPAARVWVGCANLDGDPGGYRCFVEVVKRRWRRGDPAVEAALVGQVVDVLRAALEAHPDVHGIRWSSAGS